MCDLNGDGSIDARELGGMMRALGHAVTQRQARELLRRCDADGSGALAYAEFVLLMRGVLDGALAADECDASGAGWSRGSKTLLSEAHELQTQLPWGVARARVLAHSPQPAVEVSVAGEALEGTPYAGALLRLHVRAHDTSYATPRLLSRGSQRRSISTRLGARLDAALFAGTLCARPRPSSRGGWCT